MAKFKVGDRVRVLPGCENIGCGVIEGMTGIIMENDDVPYIKFDQDLRHPVHFMGEWCAPMKECELELVSDNPDTAERDQLAREFSWLIYQEDEGYDESAGETWEGWILDICKGAFDLAEAFLAERAKRTTEK